MEITLTAKQKKALKKIQTFLKSNTRWFRLTGYAGTGKSFLMCQLMKFLVKEKVNFIAASPTNKASKNLERLAREVGLSIDCTTIARLLGQLPVLNEETGKEVFQCERDDALEHYEVVIIDEFSMISEENFYELMEAAVTSPKKTKLIFVGDAAQLPPVGEKISIVATQHFPDRNCEVLTQVVRYDGAIALAAEQIRSIDRYNHQLYPFETSNDGTIVCLPRSKWLELAGDRFKEAQYEKNPDHCRILVWRNRIADELNNWVREQLWGTDPSAYVIGDRLIARKPVFRLAMTKADRKPEWAIAINNSEEMEVVKEASLKSAYGYDYWEVPVQSETGFKIDLRILLPESEKKKQEQLKKYRETKQWFQLMKLDKNYDSCPFAHALTVHKAQGSSINHVFLDIRDIKECPDLQKMLYTALTRAKLRVYIPTENDC
ncbi:MAG: ATP-dependent DNA helicase [Xenococcaceae cyanobacterium]